MKTREIIQQIIYKIINPVVKAMVKIGITPNFITATGLFLNLVACIILIYGAIQNDRGDYSCIGWAGGVILFAGLFDMLDGQVARLGKTASRYGALFDSVLDRYSELIVLFGCCYYLILQGYFFSSLFAFIALIGSMMVSYVRARAEGLGIECKVGFMQRPERVVMISVGAIFCGIFYYFMDDYKVYLPYLPFPVFEPILIFVIPLAIVAVFSNVTAIGRLNHCRKVLTREDNEKPDKK
jgi:CDP-diacylglycerol--glycerol-3-phosphate 3-phosphatidyltransferase